MLDIKIHYDKKTTEIIDQLRHLLREYEELLKIQIEKRTRLWTCTRDIHDEFINDAGRHKILNEITKVAKISIPVKIEIIRDKE